MVTTKKQLKTLKPNSKYFKDAVHYARMYGYKRYYIDDLVTTTDELKEVLSQGLDELVFNETRYEENVNLLTSILKRFNDIIERTKSTRIVDENTPYSFNPLELFEFYKLNKTDLEVYRKCLESKEKLTNILMNVNICGFRNNIKDKVSLCLFDACMELIDHLLVHTIGDLDCYAKYETYRCEILTKYEIPR